MKIKAFTEFFVGRPVIFWSFVVGIILIGAFSFLSMPKLEDPAVAVKQAQVVLIYPGTTAHEIELKAVQLMEDELRTLPDVKHIKSDCQAGQAIITVEFLSTVKMYEMEQHFDLLRRKAGDATMKLPSGCYSPIVIDDMLDVYGLFYAFTSDGYSYSEMEKYAKLVRRELLTVPGVKRINIVGTRSEVINVILSKDKLARNGVIPTEVMVALQHSGMAVNAGKYEETERASDESPEEVMKRIQLRVSDELQDEEDVANVLIPSSGGKQIRLGDIATVERAYKEPQTGGFFVNGKPALGICLTTNAGVVVPDVGADVDKKLAEVMQRVPVGFNTEKIFFQPDQVNAAISGFMLNLLESVVIVIVILMFIYGLRGGFIIGLGLVLSIAITFPILLLMDSTLQRISLGAFIVAMGMLVDNAIVILDGILEDRKRGVGPKTYLYRIGGNTAVPMLGATVIAVLTFLPTFLSPTTGGEYCRDLFLVLCVSLLASWLFAIAQVPATVAAWMPLRPTKKETGGDGQPAQENALRRLVRRLIGVLINHKMATIIFAVAALALCLYGFTRVKQVFFPDFDYNQFVVEYYLPDQSSPDRVQRDLKQMSKELLADERVERVAAAMGSTPARYSLVRPMNNGGERYGELIVNCADFKTVKEVMNDMRPKLRQRYPDAYIRFRTYNLSISTSHLVEVEFQGPDPVVLRRLCDEAQAIMRKSPMIDPYSVQSNWRPKGKALVADYVQQNAVRSGVNRQDIGSSLLAATDGLPVGVIQDHDKSIIIQMQVRNEDGSKIQTLDDIPVWAKLNLNLHGEDLTGLVTGTKSKSDVQSKMYNSTPLSTVTDGIHMDWEEDYIFRCDGQRTIQAECDINTLEPSATGKSAEASIRDAINAIEVPVGYTMRWQGDSAGSAESTASLMGLFPIAFAFIVVILLLLFNDWRTVGIIFACVPFIMCGISPALLLSGQPFTFIAILGMMGLMGMMIKNALVLIDEINRLRNEEHQSAYDAICNATSSRALPVIMASLTTIVGMAPLIPDPMYGSMAICIMSGLTMGTLITLVFLPILYATVFHVSKKSE